MRWLHNLSNFHSGYLSHGDSQSHLFRPPGLGLLVFIAVPGGSQTQHPEQPASGKAEAEL